MKKNMGSADIAVRLIVAAIIITMYFLEVTGGTLGIILLVLAGIFVVTSILRFCPHYLPFGIKTRPNKKR